MRWSIGLIAYLPDVMHVIIISRDVPPLTLARLRSQDSLAVIERNDLLFTAQETQELFRKVFGLELTYGSNCASTASAPTDGLRPLQLVRQVAQRQAAGGETGSADPLGVLHQSERDIFEYFAEEVFSAEPVEIQKYLMRSLCWIGSMWNMCAALSELISSAVLPQLVRRNVFMTVASDARGEEYRLHPLFQSFLRRRLRTEIGLRRCRRGTCAVRGSFSRAWRLGCGGSSPAEADSSTAPAP
jgi:LuxR family maltose regulon positive regulatory protein